MNDSEQAKPRRRGLTSLVLGWLADRLRRTEEIKAELNRGTYQVDSSKVASAMVNGEKNSRKE